VNAKQVHRKRLLAARRTQDEWVRGLGDLIRTYSQSVADPDQMAAVMIGLPSPVLAASLRSLFCEAGATVETASAVVGKYMGITEARTATPEVLGGQALAAEVPAVLAAGDLRRVMEEPVRRTSAEDDESCPAGLFTPDRPGRVVEVGVVGDHPSGQPSGGAPGDCLRGWTARIDSGDSG